jgi:enoyl-CoA hydratase
MSVAIERQGPILIVSMEREAKRNAIDAETTNALDSAFNLLDDDPSLWVGILTGSATVFSAGTDLRQGSGDPTPRGGHYGLVARQRTTPLIAAVEGSALGGGFELVLACDLVIAGRTASFGLPEVTRGVLPTSGALFRGPRALPLNVAKQLILTGQPLDAHRAYSLGLVNSVVDAGTARAEAIGVATLVASNAPIAVQQSLRALDRYVSSLDDFAWRLTDEATTKVTGSADMREGVNAFFERRDPEWTGT